MVYLETSANLQKGLSDLREKDTPKNIDNITIYTPKKKDYDILVYRLSKVTPTPKFSWVDIR